MFGLTTNQIVQSFPSSQQIFGIDLDTVDTATFYACLAVLFATLLWKSPSCMRSLLHRVSLSTPDSVPESVNYHFTRQCNYKCGFCFHTQTTKCNLPLEDAKRGIKMLVEAGMKKINFSGGEPFIVNRGKHLGEMVKYAKEIGTESVTIVSNGSLIKREWFEKYAKYLDILAISCDSFNEETLKRIGRYAPQKKHLEQLRNISNWCRDFGVKFKINTVVCAHNKDETLRDYIAELNPCRWKVFQCLLIDGENTGDAIRDAKDLVVTDSEFSAFCERNALPVLVPESNDVMRNSYLILDEYMRFLDNTGGEKKPGPSVLDVGVESAMNHSGFDELAFKKRGGKYEWTKADQRLDY